DGVCRAIARQALAVWGLFLLILLVLRPAVKPLLLPPLSPAPAAALGPPLAVAGDEDDGDDKTDEPTLEGRVEQARLLTRQDPRLVAQVVRQWMQSDGK